LALTGSTADGLLTYNGFGASATVESNLTFNGSTLTVLGNLSVSGTSTLLSASYVYITSSKVVIGDNIITLNANSPYKRFAGIEMNDSGSTAKSSILWDSLGNYFFISGSTATNSQNKLIVGPSNNADLTTNYVPKATAGNTLGNSIIYDNGSNVGIGTTSPAELLDIAASADNASTAGPKVNFKKGASTKATIGVGGNYLGVGSNTNDLIIRNDAGSILFGFSGVPKMCISSSTGNVGIGTTSPIAKLHVSGSTVVPSALLFGDVGIGTNSLIYPFANRALLEMYGSSQSFIGLRNSSGNSYIQKASTDVYIWNADNGFTAFATNNSERMRIDGSGRLLLGATSVPDTGISFYNSNGTVGLAHYLSSTVGYVGTWTNHVLGFATNGSERMRIATDGNVGIGTTNPTAKLSISGSSNIRILSLYRNVASATTPIVYGIEANGSPGKTNVALFERLNNLATANISASSAGVRIREHSANYALSVEDHSGNSYLVVKGGGNVGIGSSSPAYKLDVSGNARIGTDGLAYGRLTITKATSGATLNVSYASLSSGYGEILMSNYNDNTGASGWASYIRSYSSPGSDYSSFLTFGTSTITTGAPIERMRIASNGNVGIGTSSPSAKLHVSASATTAAAVFQGNVGIGTTTVSQNKLLVYNSSAATDYTAITFSGGTGLFDNKGGISIYNPNSTTNNFSSIDFYIDQTNYSNVGAARILCRNGARSTGGTYDTDLIFITHNQGGTWNQTIINKDGNLGIGTTSPAAKLHVVDSDPTLLLQGNQLSGLRYGRIQIANQPGNLVSEIYAGYYGVGGLYLANYSNNGIFFGVSNASGTFTERMRIASDGNIGIGTTSPAYKLDVSGPISVRGTRVLTTGFDIFGGLTYDIYGNIRVLRSDSAQGDGMFIGYGGSGGPLRFFSNTGTQEFMTIATTGNVGIGTTSPAAKLEVSGSVLDYVSFSTQTSNYTMSLSDASKLIRMNVASANTVNVPTNAQVAFRVGTKVDVLQYGAGQTTITASAGSGVQIRTANNYYKLNARYGVASLVKMGTNEWAMFGNLSP